MTLLDVVAERKILLEDLELYIRYWPVVSFLLTTCRPALNRHSLTPSARGAKCLPAPCGGFGEAEESMHGT